MRSIGLYVRHGGSTCLRRMTRCALMMYTPGFGRLPKNTSRASEGRRLRSAGDKTGGQAKIFRALSITRLEGSRWCLRRTRWAMEKVRECGLKRSREESWQVRKDGGENECMETTHPFWGVVVGNPSSLMRSLRDEDTGWRRRARAR